MFNAIQIDQIDSEYRAQLTQIETSQLPDADVLVKVDYSTLNYKDGLAITGKAPVVRQFPMVPGIDLAGTVVESAVERFQPGDKVVLNGWGVGEVHWGGLAQYARLNSAWLLPLPDAFSTRDAMIIGTAGYTAGICVNALLDHGVTSEAGEILVTGASGGVGSIATALLANLGFNVVASSGKPNESQYLLDLGASEVIDRASLSEKGKPLQKERWAGVIDSVGSVTLANACAQTRYGGTVAACGLAQGADLPATVMPFILRGVTLCGIDSVMAPLETREKAWSLLSKHLDKSLLNEICDEIGLAQAIEKAGELMNGSIKGRILVNVNA